VVDQSQLDKYQLRNVRKGDQK